MATSMAPDGWIEVRGVEALQGFAQQLKIADKELAKAFRRDMRRILKPATTEAKKAALLKYPTRGGGSIPRQSPPGNLRSALARSVDTETRFTAYTTRIAVRSSKSKFNRAFKGEVGASGDLNAYASGKKRWRHPRPKGGKAGGTDFKHWYSQRGYDWLEASVGPMKPQIVAEIERLMGEYARQLTASAR